MLSKLPDHGILYFLFKITKIMSFLLYFIKVIGVLQLNLMTLSATSLYINEHFKLASDR